MLKKLPLNFAHITKRNFSSFQNPKIVKGPLFSQPLPLKPFGSLRFASNVPTTKEKGQRVLKFTLKEVNEHHSPGDIWIIIDKKIYNISDWVLKHPGGLIITNNAGSDSSYLFKTAHTHSDIAREIMEEYFIGELEDELKPRPNLFESHSILPEIRPEKVEWPSEDK